MTMRSPRTGWFLVAFAATHASGALAQPSPAVHRLPATPATVAFGHYDPAKPPVLRIRSGARRPEGAAVAVQQRGHWYWIADDDLNSKSTFGLLRLLLFLKAGSSPGTSPLITIPAR